MKKITIPLTRFIEIYYIIWFTVISSILSYCQTLWLRSIFNTILIILTYIFFTKICFVHLIKAGLFDSFLRFGKGLPIRSGIWNLYIITTAIRTTLYHSNDVWQVSFGKYNGEEEEGCIIENYWVLEFNILRWPGLKTGLLSQYNFKSPELLVII